MKTTLKSGRPDIESAIVVATAITMMAAVGDPRSMSVNANAQLGVTTPPVILRTITVDFASVTTSSRLITAKSAVFSHVEAL